MNLAGIRFENPTVLASGVLGYSAESFESVVEGGAGGIVTKSIGLIERDGYANPTVFQARAGLVNAMGLPNPGVNEFVCEIRRAKSKLGVPLIVSVYGYSEVEYASVAEKVIDAGADGVELNVSCPHVKCTGSEIGQSPKLVASAVQAVKAKVSKPIFVKLSPNVTDVVAIAEAAVKAGADGLTIMNTLRAIAIDVDTGRPVLSNVRGGLSGEAVKPVALRCVYDVFEYVNVPIFGCGGVADWRDAVEFLLAGASAVQIGTALAFAGNGVFAHVCQGVDAYLRKKGFGSVKEIVGYSHKC